MPIYAKTKFVFIGLAVLAVYSYGWKVTEINLSGLFRDFHLVKPLFKELIQPDLFSRKKLTQKIETEFFLGRNFSRQEQSANHTQDGNLILSKKSGEIGDQITIEGVDLKPDSEGTLFWVNEIEQEFPLEKFKTDSAGNFRKTIKKRT